MLWSYFGACLIVRTHIHGSLLKFLCGSCVAAKLVAQGGQVCLCVCVSVEELSVCSSSADGHHGHHGTIIKRRNAVWWCFFSHRTTSTNHYKIEKYKLSLKKQCKQYLTLWQISLNQQLFENEHGFIDSDSRVGARKWATHLWLGSVIFLFVCFLISWQKKKD